MEVLKFGDYRLIFENTFLDFFAIGTEIYKPKYLTKLIFKEKKLYYILLSDKYFVDNFLQTIIKGDFIRILTEEGGYLFDFDEYVLNIIESDFYKEVMK